MKKENDRKGIKETECGKQSENECRKGERERVNIYYVKTIYNTLRQWMAFITKRGHENN